MYSMFHAAESVVSHLFEKTLYIFIFCFLQEFRAMCKMIFHETGPSLNVNFLNTPREIWNYKFSVHVAIPKVVANIFFNSTKFVCHMNLAFLRNAIRYFTQKVCAISYLHENYSFTQ